MSGGNSKLLCNGTDWSPNLLGLFVRNSSLARVKMPDYLGDDQRKTKTKEDEKDEGPIRCMSKKKKKKGNS